MHPYSYKISLRVTHPNIDPKKITITLKLKPDHAWKAGKPRKTPKGTPLEGVYSDSYWYTNLIPNGEHSSEGTLLEDYLTYFEEKLRPSASFFDQVRAEGGRVELFIGIYGTRNYGFEFSPSLLESVAKLGLSLSFDIYHYPQKWG